MCIRDSSNGSQFSSSLPSDDDIRQRIKSWFSSSDSIIVSDVPRGQFGTRSSIWELRISFKRMVDIPFFTLASHGPGAAFLNLYVKVGFSNRSFPMNSFNVRNVIISQASNHSLFSVPLSFNNDDKMNGFVLEALLYKKMLTEPMLIDACLRIAYAFNSINSALTFFGNIGSDNSNVNTKFPDSQTLVDRNGFSGSYI